MNALAKRIAKLESQLGTPSLILSELELEQLRARVRSADMELLFAPLDHNYNESDEPPGLREAREALVRLLKHGAIEDQQEFVERVMASSKCRELSRAYAAGEMERSDESQDRDHEITTR